MKKKKSTPQSTNQPINQLTKTYHTPVLLHEAVDALAINPGGIYVDCTFGGGGHSKAILEKLNQDGKLIAFDQDTDANQNLPDDTRIVFVPQNFRHLSRFLKLHNISAIDGLLADLGVSSHQFDEAERGFSIRFDAAMDMRMDQRQAITAAEILKSYPEQQLHKLFEQYGEVTNAKTLAKTIVQLRETTQINTIAGFKNAVRGAVKGNPNKYFARVFQALRIEVNDEIGALKEMLQQIPQLLKPGGRVAIITFHSIEDRMVKNFFRRGTFAEPEENPFMNTETVSELRVITKKPIVPAEKEMKQNPRSGSAKLRVAEKAGSAQ
jgi:16S rRNA (cytosine1402-N4)-methyltransferase